MKACMTTACRVVIAAKTSPIEEWHRPTGIILLHSDLDPLRGTKPLPQASESSARSSHVSVHAHGHAHELSCAPPWLSGQRHGRLGPEQYSGGPGGSLESMPERHPPIAPAPPLRFPPYSMPAAQQNFVWVSAIRQADPYRCFPSRNCPLLCWATSMRLVIDSS